ncbi:MAG: T9SS type A sorting domain-containing protein [Bacteroidota bacterium]
MRPIQVLQILLIIISALFFRTVKAADITGGSLRYEALGGQKYKVIGTIIRNCGGATLDIPTFSIYAGTISYNLTATRTSIKDISNYCITKGSSPCSSQNTQNADGQEQHVFEVEIDFSQAPYDTFYKKGQCEVMFSMESSKRSPKTTTISANTFYLDAMLNLCALGKTGENSNTESSIPVSYLNMCHQNAYNYSFGFNEKDIDSLYHTIETPKKGKTSYETFNSPYSTSYPMTPHCLPSGIINCTALTNAKPPRGLYFDKNTGDFIITPMNSNERPIFNIKTSEYRYINDTLILVGYSTNEIFISINSCSENNSPFIPSKTSYSVCEGNKLCFTISTKDIRTINALVDDTTQLSWNAGIPFTKCTFVLNDSNAREKEAQFCWQTSKGDAKPYEYHFKVNVTDGKCEQPLGFTKTFTIKVHPLAKPKITYKKIATNQIILEANSLDKNILNYEWQIRDSNNLNLLFKSYQQKDTFTFTDTGRYFIKLFANNTSNCPTTIFDTIYLNKQYQNTIKNTIYEGISVYPNPTNGNLTIEVPIYPFWDNILLTDITGKVVYKSTYKHRIDISHLPSGIYILSLSALDKLHTVKIVKE